MGRRIDDTMFFDRPHQHPHHTSMVSETEVRFQTGCRSSCKSYGLRFESSVDSLAKNLEMHARSHGGWARG